MKSFYKLGGFKLVLKSFGRYSFRVPHFKKVIEKLTY